MNTNIYEYKPSPSIYEYKPSPFLCGTSLIMRHLRIGYATLNALSLPDNVFALDNLTVGNFIVFSIVLIMTCHVQNKVK